MFGSVRGRKPRCKFWNYTHIHTWHKSSDVYIYTHIQKNFYYYYYYSRSWKQPEWHYWHIICFVVHGWTCIFSSLFLLTFLLVRTIVVLIRFLFLHIYFSVWVYNKNLIISKFLFVGNGTKKKSFYVLKKNFNFSSLQTHTLIYNNFLLHYYFHLYLFSFSYSLVCALKITFISDYFSHKLI